VAVPGLELIGRMDYLQFTRTLLRSTFLMTDGGSNQEEAAMLGLPTLLLRMETERPDGLGDNVVLSRLEPGVIGAFVDRHAGQPWSPKIVEGPSPSANIVAHVRSSLR